VGEQNAQPSRRQRGLAGLQQIAAAVPTASALVALAISVLPAAAAPAPPTLTFPSGPVTTGGSTITVTGTGPIGVSVVVFDDLNGDGKFHSIEPNWYQTVRRDGTFSIAVFLKEDAASLDLFAFTDSGSEQSIPVKIPTVTQRPGAPIASPAGTPPAPAQPNVPTAPAPPPPAVQGSAFNVGDAVEIQDFPSSGVAPVSDQAADDGTLVYGTYSCGQPQRSAFNFNQPDIPKGDITLGPDGTYQYLSVNGGTGQYTYDQASRGISWLSGPIADLQAQQSTFKRGNTTAQIDINFGNYDWGCGVNLPR
jgi:hypothetical protein